MRNAFTHVFRLPSFTEIYSEKTTTMVIDDCSVTTVIQGINYCVVVIHQTSWLDQLNSLEPLHVSALLTATALTWYVASGIRTSLNLLGHSPNEE